MRIRAPFSVQLKVERHVHVCRRTVASSKKYFSPLSDSGFFYNGGNHYYLIENCICGDKCLLRYLTCLSFSQVTNPSQFIASYDF